MKFQIKQAENDEDWNFFYKLGFEMLKTLRRFIYDPMVENNPDASEEELLEIHRKETEDYFDLANRIHESSLQRMMMEFDVDISG